MKEGDAVTQMELPIDGVLLVKLRKRSQSFLLGVLDSLRMRHSEVILKERTLNVRWHLISSFYCSWVKLSREFLGVYLCWTVSDLLLVHFDIVNFFDLYYFFDNRIILHLCYYFKILLLFEDYFTLRDTNLNWLSALHFLNWSRCLGYFWAPFPSTLWDSMFRYPLLILISSQNFEWRFRSRLNLTDASFFCLTLCITLSLGRSFFMLFWCYGCLNFWYTLLLRDYVLCLLDSCKRAQERSGDRAFRERLYHCWLLLLLLLVYLRCNLCCWG